MPAVDGLRRRPSKPSTAFDLVQRQIDKSLVLQTGAGNGVLSGLWQRVFKLRAGGVFAVLFILAVVRGLPLTAWASAAISAARRFNGSYPRSALISGVVAAVYLRAFIQRLAPLPEDEDAAALKLSKDFAGAGVGGGLANAGSDSSGSDSGSGSDEYDGGEPTAGSAAKAAQEEGTNRSRRATNKVVALSAMDIFS